MTNSEESPAVRRGSYGQLGQDDSSALSLCQMAGTWLAKNLTGIFHKKSGNFCEKCQIDRIFQMVYNGENYIKNYMMSFFCKGVQKMAE